MIFKTINRALVIVFVLLSGVTSRAEDAAFIHPGGLHTQADFDRMKAKVSAGEHPWIDGWAKLIADPKARNTYKASPKANMGVSRQHAQDDASAAYLNAVRWHISGDTSFADGAVRNLNGWSATVNQVPSGTDQPGLSGIPIGNFALAAEVLRSYPGWSPADQLRFKAMLQNYFYPAANDFLTRHNGTHPSNYWANWDAANILSLLAIGVYCDDRAKFDQGVEYYKNGVGMGSIMHAVPFLYPDGLGQWQESGRDHAHALGGMGLLAEACQVAWNQNVDLFNYADNRLLAGANYEAQYTQWIGVPYTFYTNANNANQYYISPNYHGRLGNCEYYELLYNHYVALKHLSEPKVKRFAELLRPEGGNADIVGYGTLTYTLDAAASPYPASPAPPVPTDLSATAGISRVDLKWSPSGAYSTQGYEVSRATTSGGPYTSLYSTTSWTTPRYTDSKIENGKTYYYVVAAINQAGKSANSASVSAVPAAARALPKEWTKSAVGGEGTAASAAYSDAANHSYMVTGAGTGIGGTADSCNFVYQTVTADFTITARLITQRGGMVGLMMRDNADGNAKTLALTLGEVGGREIRFRTRSALGGKTTIQLGNDYTWLPAWLRIQRVGDAFTAYQSSDGITWFTIGTSNVTMATTYQVGLAVSAGDKPGEMSGTAAFDNVTAEVRPPSPPKAPQTLEADAPGDGTVRLAWKNAATFQTGCKIEASTHNGPFYEIADLEAGANHFVNTGLADPAVYRYRVRSYNIGGYSDYSNLAAMEKHGR